MFSFRIEDEILTEYVFIYGSKIDNFKNINKRYVSSYMCK